MSKFIKFTRRKKTLAEARKDMNVMTAAHSSKAHPKQTAIYLHAPGGITMRFYAVNDRRGMAIAERVKDVLTRAYRDGALNLHATPWTAPTLTMEDERLKKVYPDS